MRAKLEDFGIKRGIWGENNGEILRKGFGAKLGGLGGMEKLREKKREFGDKKWEFGGKTWEFPHPLCKQNNSRP